MENTFEQVNELPVSVLESADTIYIQQYGNSVRIERENLGTLIDMLNKLGIN